MWGLCDGERISARLFWTSALVNFRSSDTGKCPRVKYRIFPNVSAAVVFVSPPPSGLSRAHTTSSREWFRWHLDAIIINKNAELRRYVIRAGRPRVRVHYSLLFRFFFRVRKPSRYYCIYYERNVFIPPRTGDARRVRRFRLDSDARARRTSLPQ